MPNEQVQPSLPTPAAITPALLKTHSITDDEYALIEQKLGRTPSLTELGIFSVMWSEHCSYKSSRVHLKRLPTKGTRTSGPGAVLQGPGENAGIIDVGDGWACAFKIESHNHPSYIEPYQGAATGVGGILRDIFTMGARPMAVMDSLRFGPLKPAASVSNENDPGAPSSATASSSLRVGEAAQALDYARNRQTMRGVVHGVGGYGNCFGVPNLGGETRFEDCYSGNPLLNAFALGLVRTDEIFYAKAEGVGNPVFYVGAKTGRDGIHGATMASEEFTAGSEQKRPNVQMGDPFLEKLLLEACLEVMKTGAVLGIQDMGAAGLTCSTCEMGARGELGVTIELDKVPQRETGMTSYEIMLSESQERMLLVAEKGREHEVLAVFEKWGLDCAEVGTVTADDVMRVYHAGVLQAEIPNKALTDEAPVYHRPVGTWTAPVPKDPPAWVLEELKKPRDYTADLLKLLASPNICSKHWVYEQYDSMVQTNTVQGPGGEAGVIRIKGTGGATPGHGVPHDVLSAANGIVGAGTEPKPHSLLDTLTDLIAESTPQGEAALQAEALGSPSFESLLKGGLPSSPSAPKPERGLAMALAGNGRWCYLDPKLGAMHAVAEAARKVACSGATPVAATNCLNFGNPQKPEIMAQLSQAIDGIAEACTALGTPVTGGNVSLYNETLGEGIYPTPVIGIVGILDDVTKAVPSAFQREGEAILLVVNSNLVSRPDRALREFGCTEYARLLGALWGKPPVFSPSFEAAQNERLLKLIDAGVIRSASDVGSGGLAVALAKSVMKNEVGARVTYNWNSENFPEIAKDLGEFAVYFDETPGLLLTCRKEDAAQVLQAFNSLPLQTVAFQIGETQSDRLQMRNDSSESFIDTPIGPLRLSHKEALEAQLSDEVLA